MTDLADALRASLERHAARPALEGHRSTMTHGALLKASQARAADLRSAGLCPFEPIIVPVDNRPADLIDLIGVWLAHGVAVPVHRATPPAARAALETRLGNRFALDRSAERCALRVPERPELEGASTIVFTSGSTGDPKGVVLRADRQIAKLEMIRRQIDWQDGARTLLALQLTFSFGQWVALLTLISGGTLVLPEKLSVDAVADTLTEGRIDRLPAVPTLLRGLLGRTKDQSFSGSVMAGGEVLPAELGRRLINHWPQAELGDIYGLSETGTSDFFVYPGTYDAAAGSIGTPGAGIETRIAEDGELRIRSPWRMIGYLDAPEATAAAFDADGYFRTGDLAQIDSRGHTRLIGRAKELINRGGMKVAPLEVEAALAEHSDVLACLVTGIPDRATGEAVVACVVPAGELDTERLRSWLGERIERYKVPSRILLVDDLPTGRTGKADRGAAAVLFGEPDS
ncbi:MAG: fatty acid--CoA ligase family protein [Alphaproteobacteria bacterium]|nr:fatty acid--CoA ligase family protein [Alphaproteobacteria bacterium]